MHISLSIDIPDARLYPSAHHTIACTVLPTGQHMHFGPEAAVHGTLAAASQRAGSTASALPRVAMMASTCLRSAAAWRRPAGSRPLWPSIDARAPQAPNRHRFGPTTPRTSTDEDVPRRSMDDALRTGAPQVDCALLLVGHWGLYGRDMIAALMDVVHEAIPRVAFANGAHTIAVSMFVQSFAPDRRGAVVCSCLKRAGRGVWSQRTDRQQVRLVRRTKFSKSGHFPLRSCEAKVDAGASQDDAVRGEVTEAPLADQVLQMATTPGVADTRMPASGLTSRRRRRRTEAGSFKTTDRLIVGGALALGLSFIISTGMLVSRPRRMATVPQPVAHESRIEKSVPIDERHRWVRNSAILALATVAGMVVPLMFLLSIQNRLIYKPTRNIRGKPDNYGMIHYEDVYFCTADGHEIHGWFIKCSPEEYSKRPTFIYFHGADLNISYRLPKVFHIHSKVNCNVFLWSYRGYGMSEGFPSERGLQRDAAAMLQYLQTRRDIDQNQWWVFGESLGGAVALDFVYRFPDKIRGLVLENTFTALIDMIDLVHPYLRSFKWLITQNRWLSREKIKQLKIPVLLLSGQRDGFIPPRMMQELYDRAEQSRLRRLIRFTEGTHNKTWILPGYTEAIRKFVSDVNDAFPMNSTAEVEAADRDLDEASEPATPS